MPDPTRLFDIPDINRSLQQSSTTGGPFQPLSNAARRSNVLNALKITNIVAVQGSAITIQSVLGQAIDNLTGDFAEAIQLFAGSLANNTRRNRDVRLQRMHEGVARRGQQAMLQAYDISHPRRYGYPYNPSRFAGGVLRQALSSPSMARGQYDGIIFGDTVLLDSRAKQWYRLNFGVGTKGASRARGAGKRRGPTGIDLFNETVFRMSLKENTISNSGDRLPMPPGFFIRPGDTTRFQGETGAASLSFDSPSAAAMDSVPARRQQGKGKDFFLPVFSSNPSYGWLRTQPNFFRGRKRTRGIAGSYYLDEGVRVIARELGPAWSNLISVWFDEAAQGIEASPVLKRSKKTGQEGELGRLNAVVQKKTKEANGILKRAVQF